MSVDGNLHLRRFCIATCTLSDWLKTFAPFCSFVIQSELHAFASSFGSLDCPCLSFVIGQSDSFGFGFTTLN